jgi:hypothetical protein
LAEEVPRATVLAVENMFDHPQVLAQNAIKTF